ncbi:MAG: thioesterase family protein, partial [Ignavibacteriaceae bacterium]
NIVYVKWLEDLRCKLFEQIFPIESLLKENLYPVVISTNIIYKNQLKISDKPVGKIWIDGVSHNIMKLKIEYMINDKKCAIAEQRCILMNLKNIMMDKSKLKILYSETGDL